MSPLKLNLGCRDQIIPEYENIDLYHHKEGVIDGDVRVLSYLPGSVDEILAHNLLEHLSHKDAKKALKHWFELLKKGGKLSIQTPDLMRLLRDQNPISLQTRLYGTDEPGQAHRYCWYREQLVDYVGKVGFKLLSNGDWMDDMWLEMVKP